MLQHIADIFNKGSPASCMLQGDFIYVNPNGWMDMETGEYKNYVKSLAKETRG